MRYGFIPRWVRNGAARFEHRNAEPELRVVRKLLIERRGTALDVGAANGIYCLFMVGAASRVIAFEPRLGMADRIHKRYRLTAEAVAISNEVGSTMLRVPRYAQCATFS